LPPVEREKIHKNDVRLVTLPPHAAGSLSPPASIFRRAGNAASDTALLGHPKFQENSMTRSSALAFAVLIGLAGVAQAQSGPPLDPYGRPYIGSQNWHAEPGDYTREAPGPQPAYGRMSREQTMAPMERSSHPVAFKDEFGFRYDAEGDRLDAQGHVMSPQNPNPSR